MKIYAMSDIHGCIAELDEALSLIDLSGNNMLILCGDYIHGYDSYSVLDRITALQEEYGNDRVIALMGNHEKMVIDGEMSIVDKGTPLYDEEREAKYAEWMQSLPRYYETEKQIFVHAGICEEAEELWQWSTTDDEYLWQFSKRKGRFCKDIIAGHTGTSTIARNRHFHDIYYDGQSHYYIDGSTRKSHKLPVLMYDTDTGRYYRMTRQAAWPVIAYEPEYSSDYRF